VEARANTPTSSGGATLGSRHGRCGDNNFHTDMVPRGTIQNAVSIFRSGANPGPASSVRANDDHIMLSGSRQDQFATRCRVAQGIVNQDGQYLSHPVAVGVQQQRIRAVNLHLHGLLLQTRCDPGDALFQQRLERER